MGLFAAGQVVSVPFPYSDLTGQKLRPVLLLAFAGRADWILCQITSNPYADPLAVELTDASFASGGLRNVSYARPSKLFTASESLATGHLGTLRDEVLRKVQDQLIALIRAS